MKNIVGIVLIFVLVLPFTGTYSWFYYQQYRLKKEVKLQMIRGIDKKQLTLIKGTHLTLKSGLKWIHDKEFELHGQLYDIVERHVIGDSVYLYCWPDHKETQLHHQLSRLVLAALGHHQPFRDYQKRLADFFKIQFVNPSGEAFACLNPPRKSRYPLRNYTDRAIRSNPPPSPPPKTGC